MVIYHVMAENQERASPEDSILMQDTTPQDDAHPMTPLTELNDEDSIKESFAPSAAQTKYKSATSSTSKYLSAY